MRINKQKWIFDLSKLQYGDVLFSRSKIVGAGIARMTGGRFGHVMLYLGNTIIHAERSGVWSLNPQRLLVNDVSRLAAFRLKSSSSLEALKHVELHARARIGSLYSIPEAVSSLPLLPSKATDRFIMDRQFCSRLVAQVFAQAGINLVADFNFCTPNEIAESNLLMEIPDAVRLAEREDIAIAESPDYNRQIQKECFRWLNKIRELAEKHKVRQITSQSDVGKWILEYPRFDEDVCSYINETEYISLFDSDRRKLPWRYDPQLMLEYLISCPSPIEAYNFERQENQKNYSRVYQGRLVAIQNARSGLGYFKLDELLQTMRLGEMIAWRDALDYAEAVMCGGGE